jgi:hypothetical protein
MESEPIELDEAINGRRPVVLDEAANMIASLRQEVNRRHRRASSVRSEGHRPDDRVAAQHRVSEIHKAMVRIHVKVAVSSGRKCNRMNSAVGEHPQLGAVVVALLHLQINVRSTSADVTSGEERTLSLTA